MTLEYQKPVLLQVLLFRRFPEKDRMFENSGEAVVQASNHEGQGFAERRPLSPNLRIFLANLRFRPFPHLQPGAPGVRCRTEPARENRLHHSSP
jgi:hypothetical protein